jgi:hypothetical protein
MAEIQASSTIEKGGIVSKEKKGKLRTSAYMITVNTNKPMKDIENIGPGKVSVFNVVENKPKFKDTFDQFIGALEHVFAGQNIKKFIN